MTQYFCSLPNPGEPGNAKELFTDDPALIERFIKAEDRPGRGVYECINPLVPGARRRSLETVAELRRLYFDLDLQNIAATRIEVITKVRRLPIGFVWGRDSGSGNLHIGIDIKDPPSRGTPEYDRVVAVWKRLAEKLAADPAPVHPAALIRCLGTHNTKNGNNGECRQLWNGDRPLDLSELEELDDLLAEPLLTRKARPARDGQGAETPGERKIPIDVEARLADMRHKGPGESSIHQTQLSVTASLLRSGVSLLEATRIVLEATRIAAANDPSWNWRREELTILRMGCDFIVKRPELAVLLPDKWREPFAARIARGRRPDIGFNSDFYVRSKQQTGPDEATHARPRRKTADNPTAGGEEPHKSKPQGWNYYNHTEIRPQRWCVKQLLPESGVGIVSGQWGSFKTTAALDLSVAVMTAEPFAGQYRIKRRGGVLYFATEGAGTLQARLAAIARHRGAPDELPFAWRSDCPMLTDKDAGKTIVKMVDDAAAHFEHAYGVPVTLIWVDTYITAAGLNSSGDDNDAAATQKAFSTLRFVAARSKAFVVTIDHLGKVIEAGTRGSSGKEGNADTVLATLADREITGAVSNGRMAVRKQRDGISGFEVPFVPEMIDLGLDEDGDPVTAIVLRWSRQQREQPAKKRKSKDAELLCHVLAEIVAKHGFAFQPDPGGPTVQACHGSVLRASFYERRHTEGTPKQKLDKRRAAYERAMRVATAAALLAVRDWNGEEVIWAK
jgi:AAA domain